MKPVTLLLGIQTRGGNTLKMCVNHYLVCTIMPHHITIPIIDSTSLKHTKLPTDSRCYGQVRLNGQHTVHYQVYCTKRRVVRKLLTSSLVYRIVSVKYL